MLRKLGPKLVINLRLKYIFSFYNLMLFFVFFLVKLFLFLVLTNYVGFVFSP